MRLASGRHISGKRSSPDARDYHYARLVRVPLLSEPVAGQTDLRYKGPPTWDQGPLGSCEAQAAARWLAYQYPDYMASRLDLYYRGRAYENNLATDTGVQTRDMLKTMVDGSYSEDYWAYDIDKFKDSPPVRSIEHRAGSYSRLTMAHDVITCLTNGNPFIFTFEVPNYFDADDIYRHGVLKRRRGEISVGQHCVTGVGHDTNFKASDAFVQSGLSPDDVDDVMVLAANSWGPLWAPTLAGHFWISMNYILDPATGADAWAPHSVDPATDVPTVAGVPIGGHFIT